LVTAWATLTLLALPIIIAASEEALRAVPKGAINAALALGASRLQMIRTVRVPMALPGILTSCLLAVGQVAGETAPLLITAVYAGQHGGSDGGVSPFVGLLTLPSHIYMLSVGETQDFGTYSEQAATALLYLGLVFVFGIGTVIARSKLRQQILQRA
jgi:phosphate transport system permease protein